MFPLKRRPFRTFGRRLVAATATVGLLMSTFSVAPVLAADDGSKDTSAKAADTSTKSDSKNSKDGLNRDAWRKLQTMMNRRAMDQRGPGARPNAQGQWRGRYRTQTAYGYHRRSPAGPAWARYQHGRHGAQMARYHKHHRGGQQMARHHRGGPQWARNTYRHGSAWARMNFGRGHGPARFAQARYHSRHGRSAWARHDFNRGRSNHYRGGPQFAGRNHRGHDGRGMGAGGPQFAGRGGQRGQFGQGSNFGPRGYLAQRGFSPRGGFGFAGGPQGFGPGFGGNFGGPNFGAGFGQRGFGSGPGPSFADRNFGPPAGRMAGFNRNRDGAQDVSKLEARIDGLEHRIDALLDQLAKLQPASAQK